MALQLILPKSARRQILRCLICGLELDAEQEQQFARHVKACYRRNSEVIEEHVAAQASNVFQSPADTELYAHIRRGGN